ncbi:hypothetical protein CHU32_08325 [Superficieibacter electus]|uniref:Uncharacterized protein n=1 Tax=Superficieibacter electus TaxID=2022662 RepID=A0A2P5GRB3_9ENTR|nr:hypothetical protein [Superficieibacter electus]POP45807.1 hypothetical protein CHU33_06780 [Superficieibacter electus]POP49113.1 hypothetical protein CHU32_08325 [Superficieibacter electus]
MTNIFTGKINYSISNLKNNNDLSFIFKSFEEYCDDLISTRTGLVMRGVDGAPDWYGYEMIIWKSVFKYIEPILKMKKFRGKNELLDGMLSLCLRKEYGKGRQSLVMLIGKYGAIDYASSLARLIDDPEISIHVIGALTQLKDLSHFEQIKNISEEKNLTSKRTYARKYMKKLAPLKLNQE